MKEKAQRAPAPPSGSQSAAYDRRVGPSEIQTVAVISTGEMGAAVGRRLRLGGLRVVTSLHGRSGRSRDGALDAGIEDAGSLADAVQMADLVLSILPPGRALELAEAVGRDAGPLYADCNAISPETAVRVGGAVGHRYVDVGIIGAPQAPRFYASGPHAAELARLPLDLRVLEGPIGRASALKMCYASLTKGLIALLTESMVTAEGAGLRDTLERELAESQPGLLEAAQRGVPGMVPKAYRWVAEMEEIAATFAAHGLTPRMLEGAADVYRFVESAALPAGPRTLDEVVADLHRSLTTSGPRAEGR
jgi:3-hydroxyisobutyrate dehydrogenase-like beta-hydroxyacid dehydrogenase